MSETIELTDKTGAERSCACTANGGTCNCGPTCGCAAK